MVLGGGRRGGVGLGLILERTSSKWTPYVLRCPGVTSRAGQQSRAWLRLGGGRTGLQELRGRPWELLAARSEAPPPRMGPSSTTRGPVFLHTEGPFYQVSTEPLFGIIMLIKCISFSK